MIIVTGADGMVGRAVCDILRAAGQGVIPIVHHKREITAPDAQLIDLSQTGSLAALKSKNIRGIIHLAAVAPHSSRYPDTEHSAQLTRAIDSNVLMFSRLTGSPIIYMSTCGLYDKFTSTVKLENDNSNIKIESPYFSAKYDGEKLFLNESAAVIMRLAAPVGPGQKPDVVLSRFIMAARANRAIQIWGSGTREQNFIDVRDVARLIHQVIVHIKPCLINVAGSGSTTMLRLASAVISVIGKGRVEHVDKADPRDGETARYSIAKAYEIYKWQPHYSLRDSCKWIANEDFVGNA